MFENKLYKYLTIEVLKSFLLVVTSFSLLIWIVQAAKFLSLITENGFSIFVYIKYIIYIFPKVVSRVAIISFLISLFLTILKFQDSKEFEIYWLSGISKIQVVKLILKISFIPTLFSLLFYLYLAPVCSFKSREIIANSEFSMVNSLMKKGNFNSPLKDLTIFVHRNDNKGNVEKVYIFEKFKTIIAKKGRVLNIDDKNYLELIDGFIHEKNSNNNIAIIKFEKTLFDFTKYQTTIVKNPKNQERSTLWLLNKYKSSNNNNEKNELMTELHQRIFKSLFIPTIAILCSFILYSNNEKINLLKLKITIFSISTLFIIFLEILINHSVKNIVFQYTFYTTPFLGAIITLLILNNFLKNEPIYK